MINTTGQLISAIVTQQIIINKTNFSDPARARRVVKLEDLKAAAVAYPGLIAAAKKGILSGDRVATYHNDYGFIISEPLRFTASMSEELTSADQTKLNEGV